MRFNSNGLKTKLLLSNTKGQILDHQDFELALGWNQLHWDISQLSSGTYFISKITGAKRETVKFIVQEK